jgi:glycerate 2-kinase
MKNTKRILIAPDSFKHSISAQQAANAIARGIQTVLPDSSLTVLPLADGGEGTLEVLAGVYHSAQWKTIETVDPMGRPIQAQWLWLEKQKTAVIELARASGVHLLQEHERNPLLTSTRGTGLQILDAFSYQPEKIIVTLGGSATVDGASGIASALGYRFFDVNDVELPMGGGALVHLDRIDCSMVHPALKNIGFYCLVDVSNPLLGSNGAAMVYGPQKGASPSDVIILEQSLNRLSEVASQTFAMTDVQCRSGAGSAGGSPAGLHWFCKAKWKPGAEMILDLIGFEELLLEHDLVITGEGCLDQQSLSGKLVYTIAKRNDNRIPLWVIAGTQKSGWEAMKPLISRLDCLESRAIDSTDSIVNAEQYLSLISAEVTQVI